MNPTTDRLHDGNGSAPYTLVAPVTRSGVGLHTGELTKVTLKPASVGKGRYFVRVDLPETPIIPAKVENVRQTTLSTELAVDRATVRTVEHLLAALGGMGVDDVRIEVEGPEIPLLDGSAWPWVEAIAQVGIREGSGIGSPEPAIAVDSPQWIRDSDAFVAALPSPELRFSYGIDFDVDAIGNQWHSWSPARGNFATAIAPARTFGLAHQVDQLRRLGLIEGGSLDNALVCSHEGWINPPLRFANEPVRHKILDLVGDISLLGQFPVAHFIAYKASHNLHVQLARLLVESKSKRLERSL